MRLKKAVVSDKIYFTASDSDDIQTVKTRFMYDNWYTTLKYSDGIYAAPSGSLLEFEITDIDDRRPQFEKKLWTFKGQLKPSQAITVEKLFKNNELISGLLQAPCGWGKTFVGAYMIARSGKPTLIICHTKLLAYQWLETLNNLLSDEEIGFIGDGKLSIKPITIGIYKSLSTRLDQVKNRFQNIIVDEAHLCMASVFNEVVVSMNCTAKIALSATPTRRDGLHVAFKDFFTNNFVKAEDISMLTPSVEIHKTMSEFKIRDPQRDWTKQLTVLAKNTAYLNVIAEQANLKIAHGRCLLILSERIEMLDYLLTKIPYSVKLVGATKNESREEILAGAGTKYKAILSTRIFDEGISCHRLDTLFFTCPSSNYAKLEQRIGRILREHPDKHDPLVVDFWLRGAIVSGQQASRYAWYLSKNFTILGEEN